MTLNLYTQTHLTLSGWLAHMYVLLRGVVHGTVPYCYELQL